MKYVDEYRDPVLASRVLKQIRDRVTRPWVLMEVCGGQTHGLLKSGIVDELDGVVELIHGPGCPVCVTPVSMIDVAQQLSLRPDTVVASFGDMLRVPGTRESLLAVRGRGGDVRVVYSPLDAVSMAQKNPQKMVVFFAVGFETTAPATALAVLQAHELKLQNFCLLVAHVRVQPAMEAILQSAECRVQAFLAAGHVCTVLGYESYRAMVDRYHVPIVVTGFEPVDLLMGIYACIDQLESGETRVQNEYQRSVRADGNTEAIRLVSNVYQIADRAWRGLGSISAGGLALRAEWKQYDAEHHFNIGPTSSQPERGDCLSGDVLAGRIKPTSCPSFGTTCRPETPLGAPMVSSEGACAAYFRHCHLAPPQVSISRQVNGR